MHNMYTMDTMQSNLLQRALLCKETLPIVAKNISLNISIVFEPAYNSRLLSEGTICSSLRCLLYIGLDILNFLQLCYNPLLLG